MQASVEVKGEVLLGDVIEVNGGRRSAKNMFSFSERSLDDVEVRLMVVIWNGLVQESSELRRRCDDA